MRAVRRNPSCRRGRRPPSGGCVRGARRNRRGAQAGAHVGAGNHRGGSDRRGRAGRRRRGTRGRRRNSERRRQSARHLKADGMRHRIVLVNRSELTREFGLDASIVAILTARHGSVENPRGIDVRKALRLADAGVSLESCGRGISERSPEYIRRVRADVVVEVTPLRIAPRQVAFDHVLAALRTGKHVITANKGPVVYHYRQLRELARKNRVGFRYEGTVMDGAPVFNLFQEALRGARVESFEGILNSTTNLVLSEIEAGHTYADGVEAARRIGFLETDPSMDLDGWDATVKACLLANVLMDGHVRPERVPRQGVSSLAPEAVRDALMEGKRLKQIARGWRDGRTVTASVSIEEVGPDHPLYSVNGTSSSLLVRTNMLKKFQIIERDPALRQTAFAVYSDLIAIHEGRLSP